MRDSRALRGRQGRLVWTLLVARRGQLVAQDELAEALWPGASPESWRSDLAAVVSRLRTVLVQLGLDRRAILHEAGSYRLDLPNDTWVDVEAADVALRDGRYQEAAELTRPALLPGDDAAFLEQLRARQRGVLVAALEAMGQEGDVMAAEEAVGLEPLRESAHRALMGAFIVTGNQAAALRAYEDCRRRLAEELGAAPAPATQRMYEEALGVVEASEVAPEVRRHVPVPARVTDLRRVHLVGRDRELAELDRLASGPARLVVVEGEAGVGKTRLVAELAVGLHAQGRNIVLGRCDQHPILPYQPIDEALPDLPPVRADGDPAVERHRLFEQVADRLAGLAPVVLFLDDLQWADEPTLLVLRHLLRAPRLAGFKVVAARRYGVAAELADALVVDLSRDDLTASVWLQGLEQTAVEAILAPSGFADRAEQVHSRTGGNPFLVREVARHLADTGGRSGVPDGVRQATAVRLAPLSPDAQAVLLAGAVCGPTFDAWMAEPVAEVTGDRLVDALEEAVLARLLQEVPGHLDSYAFPHDLLREAVLAPLPASRQARLHSRVARTLIEHPERTTPAAIARHLLDGMPDDLPLATEWCNAAGHQALTALAYEDAVRHHKDALAVLNGTGEAGLPRADTLLRLGEALRCAGEGLEARAVLTEATEDARRLDSPERLARAALIMASRRTPTTAGRASRTLIGLFEEALAALPEGEPALRCESMARLALELGFVEGEQERSGRLAASALELARQLADARLEGLALTVTALGLTKPAELVDLGRVLLTVAQRSDAVEQELFARVVVVAHSIQCGRHDEAAAEIAAYEAEATALGIPAHLWWPVMWRGSRALFEGRVGDARAAIDEASATGEAAQGVGAVVQTWFQRVALAHATTGIGQDLVDEHDLYQQFSSDPGRYPGIGVWLRWQVGDSDAAAAQLSSLGPELPAAPDGNWLFMSGLLAEAAAGLGAADATAVLYDRLRPFPGHYLTMGFGTTPFGSVDLVLGRCAASLGERPLAIGHLQDAAAGFEQRGAKPWLARAETDLAAVRGE